jgi:hypothetical protein
MQSARAERAGCGATSAAELKDHAAFGDQDAFKAEAT